MKIGFRGYGRKGLGRFEAGGPNRSKGVGVTPERVLGWLRPLMSLWRRK